MGSPEEFGSQVLGLKPLDVRLLRVASGNSRVNHGLARVGLTHL